MKSVPIVTIVLPVYNGSSTIARAIDSILKQTLCNFELLVIDDGSIDKTDEIVAKTADHDSRIHLLGCTHRGLVPCLNQGIRQARGKYIARMDADDVCVPSRIQKQVDFLEKHSDYGLVGSLFWLRVNERDIMVDSLPLEDEEIKLSMRYLNPFTHGAVMVRTEILRKHHLTYSGDDCYIEDYALWVRMMPYTKFHIINEPLYVWSLSKDGITSQHLQQMKKKFRKIAHTIPFDTFSPDTLSKRSLYSQKLLLHLGLDYLQHKKIARGFRLIATSFKMRPMTYINRLIPYCLRKDLVQLPLDILLSRSAD